MNQQVSSNSQRSDLLCIHDVPLDKHCPECQKLAEQEAKST